MVTKLIYPTDWWISHFNSLWVIAHKKIKGAFLSGQSDRIVIPFGP